MESYTVQNIGLSLCGNKSIHPTLPSPVIKLNPCTETKHNPSELKLS